MEVKVDNIYLFKNHPGGRLFYRVGCERGIGPHIAVGPERSAGRRECPRKLVYPMSWPEGEEVVPSPSL